MAHMMINARRQPGGSIPFLVRLLTFALLAGGLGGAVTSFTLAPGFWPWPLPGLASRFLAGAAAAYVVGSLITLTRHGWPESELLLVTVIAYGIPLVAAIMLNADAIDWTRPIAWGFVALVAPALAIALWYVWSRRGRARAEAFQAPKFSRALRIYLLGLGVLAELAGLVVFIATTNAGFLWPWAALPSWSALDSRLIASMFLAVACGSFLALWRDDRGVAFMFLPMLWAYCVVAGVALTMHAALTPDLAVTDFFYTVILALILGAGIGLYTWERGLAPMATVLQTPAGRDVGVSTAQAGHPAPVTPIGAPAMTPPLASAAPPLAEGAAAAPTGTMLWRVAWLAILLGLALELLLLAIATVFGNTHGVKPLVAQLVQSVSWSFLVCVGLAIGTATAEDRPQVAGMAGLLAAPLAFTMSRVAHKSTLEALSLSGSASAGLSPIVLATVKGIEYGCLGLAIYWMTRRYRGGIAAHLGVGLGAGLIFGSALLALTFRSTPTPPSTATVLSSGVNEIIFPVGCSLVLYTAGVLGKRIAL